MGVGGWGFRSLLGLLLLYNKGEPSSETATPRLPRPLEPLGQYPSGFLHGVCEYLPTLEIVLGCMCTRAHAYAQSIRIVNPLPSPVLDSTQSGSG